MLRSVISDALAACAVTKGSAQEQGRHFRFATRQPQLALTYTPTEQWEDHAKPLVISQFTILTLQGARVYGSFDFLPQLFERADAKSTLHKVCNAVASACFANRSEPDSAGFSHKKLYVKALQSLSNDISHVEKQKQDQTLVAVWLLCLYEVGWLKPCHSVLTFYGVANTGDTSRPATATRSNRMVAFDADIPRGEGDAISAGIPIQ
ncbi:hypothetical protein APSETT445_000970 [Aspergillus pseudonomiae]